MRLENQLHRTIKIIPVGTKNQLKNYQNLSLDITLNSHKYEINNKHDHNYTRHKCTKSIVKTMC